MNAKTFCKLRIFRQWSPVTAKGKMSECYGLRETGYEKKPELTRNMKPGTRNSFLLFQDIP